MTKQSKLCPGFTWRSIFVSLFTILTAAIFIQHTAVTDEWCIFTGNEVLGVPAIIAFVLVLALAALFYSLCRFNLLTLAELHCVLFATLLATPLMASSFWRYMLAVTNTIPRAANFAKYDAFPSKLWPHGPNLLRDSFGPDMRSWAMTHGDVRWETIDVQAAVDEDREHEHPPEFMDAVVMHSTNDHAVTSIRIQTSVSLDKGVIPEQPYLITVLVRARDLGSQSYYFCRVYHDWQTEFSAEAFASSKQAERNWLHKGGFVRTGVYGVTIPAQVQSQVVLEFGLYGSGKLELCDPELINVNTLESAFVGREIVTAEEFRALPSDQRAGLIVEPETLWSLAGLCFILNGYFPLREWLQPLGAWILFFFFILTSTFAMAVIMRRQWMENERYPMPLAKIPLALLDKDENQAVGAIWKNPNMWTGFTVVLFWCLMRGWRAFNPSVPDMNIEISLKQFFTDPNLLKMFGSTTFKVTSLYLALGLLMELNVLLSVVLGYFLFRLQYYAGEIWHLATAKNYPFKGHQLVGGYLAYALLIVLFTWKYLWSVLRKAWVGEQDCDEPMTYRTAFLTLAVSFVGVMLWALWLGLPPLAMALYFLFILSIGLVAAKLRAECGLVGYRFFPFGGEALLLIPLFGGIGFFMPQGLVFLTFLSVIVFALSFFHLPGLQMEMIETGRQLSVKPRHMVYAGLLGLFGGILIGGWVYLSSAYAIGADNYPIATGEFSTEGDFKMYNEEMSRTSEAYLDGKPIPFKTGPELLALGFAAGVTALLTLMRQLFAGFFFHPIGFILGPTFMAEQVWGSLLSAWVIRFTVLKLGGAATVRKRLMPFAVGMFLGTVAAYLLFALINGWLYFYSPGLFKPRMEF